jgi:hypothetical protein
MSNGWNRWCATDYDQWFSNFIKAPRTGDILVPAKSKITEKIQLKFPVGVNGIQKWCVAYGVTEDLEKNQNEILSIVTRKVLYLDVLIWWTGKIDYGIAMWNITKNINDKGELEIGMKIKNLWNVDSVITIQWNISNIFGFKRPIVMSGTILQNKEGILTANIWPLPFYKWMFTIKLTIKDKPEFGFDGAKFGIDPKIIAWWEKTITMLYFRAHWRMLVTLLLCMTILYTTLRKRKAWVKTV